MREMVVVTEYCQFAWQRRALVARRDKLDRGHEREREHRAAQEEDDVNWHSRTVTRMTKAFKTGGCCAAVCFAA